MSDASELGALAEKYRELIQLRSEPGPKDGARLRALATRFPGSLRELDTRTMASLEARAHELDAALAGAEPPAWAGPQIRFHGWLRVALRMRAEGVRELAVAEAWLRAYAPREPGDPDPSALAMHLSTLIDPPGGRVSLAARLVLDAPDVDLDALLFGP